MKFFITSIPTHGSGAYYSVSLLTARYGKGIRISVGGYGWAHKGLSCTHYPSIATHISLFFFTVSFLHK